MRILLCNRPGGAFAYITDGWFNAFRDAGFTVERWSGQMVDWAQFNPDLYIGCSGHRQPIPINRRGTKVAIHVNPYSTVSVPGIDEAQHAIKWTVEQRPNVVFGYGFATHHTYWLNWVTKHNISWVPMPTAGDVVIYRMPAKEDRTIGLGYVGGRWGYKAKNIDKYLLPLAAVEPVKIMGWGDWPDNTCSGSIDDNAVPAFFGQCRVAPCVSEPHTSVYGIDLPERVFKTALCGALPIHDPVVGLKDQIPSLMVASDANHYIELCRIWSQPDMESRRAAQAALVRKEIWQQHTYHHRLAGLLTALGFQRQSLSLLSALEKRRLNNQPVS